MMWDIWVVTQYCHFLPQIMFIQLKLLSYFAQMSMVFWFSDVFINNVKIFKHPIWYRKLNTEYSMWSIQLVAKRFPQLLYTISIKIHYSNPCCRIQRNTTDKNTSPHPVTNGSNKYQTWIAFCSPLPISKYIICLCNEIGNITYRLCNYLHVYEYSSARPVDQRESKYVLTMSVDVLKTICAKPSIGTKWVQS